jgi:hypothetical protein
MLSLSFTWLLAVLPCCLTLCVLQADDDKWFLTRSKRVGCLGHLISIACTILRIFEDLPGTRDDYRV